jgi:hypothetical protein
MPTITASIIQSSHPADRFTRTCTHIRSPSVTVLNTTTMIPTMASCGPRYSGLTWFGLGHEAISCGGGSLILARRAPHGLSDYFPKEQRAVRHLYTDTHGPRAH